MMRKYLIVLCICALTGCAQGRWYKAGASQQTANKDHYVCLQESQQRVSSSKVNAKGGASQKSFITNNTLYNACMAAQGYVYRRTQ